MVPTYKTQCPDCKADGRLRIIGGTFAARAPLTHFGYQIEDMQTIELLDENVECEMCGAVFTLRDLRWEKEVK